MRYPLRLQIALALAGALLASVAAAAPEHPASACGAEADPSARLACYDRFFRADARCRCELCGRERGRLCCSARIGALSGQRRQRLCACGS